MSKRAVLFFHHIMNKNKKRALQDMSIDFKLSGWCKFGFPGVVVVQGESLGMHEYVRRIKAMRWQQVRVETIDDVDDDKSFGNHRSGLQEVEAISDITQALRPLGLEPWFRKAMGYAPK
ncbi:hypothetical protein JAAARDRAFT_194533 [Jaapia argillacea MUCL 33604]|uniref:Small nuclear ribonucleoprotein Prp3 C-terminal domain-containing protein n=1 Tax=Jaapia argillacea MUCL 33604 TaxID=933084 RepID=A0A067Q1Q9_9AGAM|nr:hypothetical protein JAAARDRAFT_194533 [Jaapia argillacea MUCL 33604]